MHSRFCLETSTDTSGRSRPADRVYLRGLRWLLIVLIGLSLSIPLFGELIFEKSLVGEAGVSQYSLNLIDPHGSDFKGQSRQPIAATTNRLNSGEVDVELSWALFEYQPGELLVPSKVREGFAEREASILEFFEDKWRGKGSERNKFAAEFELLAAYYARHDQAYELIIRLKRQPVYLAYAANNFRTDVRGDQLRVRSIKIHFDPARAAVLGRQEQLGDTDLVSKLTVSSADALLHELLHADVVLANERNFLASGALHSGFYPHQHEMEVISLERSLFAEMSNTDNIPRPSRLSHSGYLVASSCATCRK